MSITKTPLTRSSRTSAVCSVLRRRSSTSPRSDSARATSAYSVIVGFSRPAWKGSFHLAFGVERHEGSGRVDRIVMMLLQNSRA